MIRQWTARCKTSQVQREGSFRQSWKQAKDKKKNKWQSKKNKQEYKIKNWRKKCKLFPNSSWRAIMAIFLTLKLILLITRITNLLIHLVPLRTTLYTYLIPNVHFVRVIVQGNYTKEKEGHIYPPPPKQFLKPIRFTSFSFVVLSALLLEYNCFPSTRLLNHCGLHKHILLAVYNTQAEKGVVTLRSYKTI